MSFPRENTFRGFLLTGLVFAGLLFALIFVPAGQWSSASDARERGQRPIGEDHGHGLDNYDIRRDKKAAPELENIRERRGKSAPEVAIERGRFADGEKRLKEKVRNLRVEYSETLKVPEVIGVDTRMGVGMLTAASRGKRPDTLRAFVRANRGMLGLTDEEVTGLRTVADYTNPEDSLSMVRMEQTINDIPVFQGEIKAGFTKRGEIIRVINSLAPGVGAAPLGDGFGDPVEAVRQAYGHIGSAPTRLDTELDAERSTDLKKYYGPGIYATTAEMMYFPTEPGVVVPAWRILINEDARSYYVVVDALTGTMLWRKDLTSHQTQPATYGVYRNANAMIDVADSPAPLTPGPVSPVLGTQGAMLTRTSISRIGNEGVYSFNNNGWIADGGTTTVGNNVRAGIDRDGVNGVDTNGEAVSLTRNFVYSYSPFNPNLVGSGDAPVPTTQTYPPSDYQQGSITQMFWITNWWHDEMYRLGFTEQALNFQFDNFGRGGLGGDRVQAESQDSSGTNNANMSTPADGSSAVRMQMYIFTPPTPDVDAALDADIVIHELTHGLSNRLHLNSVGLSTNMARGMGEGWSDFYAHAMLSEPTDPVDGIYTTGGYSTYALRSTVPTANYYYGIRRFPKAVMSAVGTNGRPYNPFTFQDIDATKINIGDGAFAPAFTASAADQVHAAGEVWSTILWEVRARLVQRLGGEAGNRRALQLVTNGMKLSPGAPTFIQARDAIIAAAQASSTADLEDVWRGFATRGMGASARVDTAGSGSGTARVTEAFDLPLLILSGTPTISDFLGDNDGTFEPGETLRFTVQLANTNWNNASGVTLSIGQSTPVSFGAIASGGSASNTIDYTVPAETPCGSALMLTFNISSDIGSSSFTRTILIGSRSSTFQENFDSVLVPNLPNGWTATQVQNGINFVTSANYADSLANSAFAANPTTVGGGTNLTSPAIPITISAATLTFRHRYDTEANWDGGVLEISLDNGVTFQDIVTAGGRFISGGYNGSLGTGTNNPLNGRSAWQGNSGGFVTTEVQLPATASGQSVILRWRFGSDDNGVGTSPFPGWYIDNISVNSSSSCSFVASGSLAGTVRYYGGSQPLVPGVTLTAAGTPQVSVTTAAAGNYSLSGLGSGSYTVTAAKTGDVNGIASADASRVAQASAGLVTLTANQQIAADATGNGTVSSADASRIAQFIVGLNPTGVTGTWKFSPSSRTYGSVSSNLTGEDYTAILVGDVTGNWTAPAALTESSPALTSGLPGLFSSETLSWGSGMQTQPSAKGAPVEVVIGEIGDVRQGEVITIPVRVGDLSAANVTSFDLEISYDPSALRPVLGRSVDGFGTISSNFVLTPNPNVPGRLRVSGFGVSPLSGSGELMKLSFRVVNPRRVTGLKWERFTFNEGEVPARTRDGVLRQQRDRRGR